MNETPPVAIPHDLSPWGMFMAADIVVQIVMLGLVAASIVTWTICLAKTLELMVAGRRARRVLRLVMGATTLDAAARETARLRGRAPALVEAAFRESLRSADYASIAGGAGLKERVVSHLSRIEAGEARRMMRGTGILASIGSTAPFVGLFGTVWGIMNAFIGISQAQTTNLAVVAPGIAEALLATGIGLVAAIPAVIIYNAFARAIAGYRALLGDIAAATARLVSRDLDRSSDVSREQRLAAE